MNWYVGFAAGFAFLAFACVLWVYWILDFDRRELWRELNTMRQWPRGR